MRGDHSGRGRPRIQGTAPAAPVDPPEVDAWPLDHVSIVMPFQALERIGFRVTLTPDSSRRHGRVLLDRMYLEVSPASIGHLPAAPRWFVTVDDAAAAVAYLRRRGMPVSDPTPYQGYDGTWLDIEIQAVGVAPVLPLLTRRVDVDRRDWPPRLVLPHPNGAVRIEEVHLRARAPGAVEHALAAIGARPTGSGHLVLPGGTGVWCRRATDAPEGIERVAVARDTDPALWLDLSPIPITCE